MQASAYSGLDSLAQNGSRTGYLVPTQGNVCAERRRVRIDNEFSRTAFVEVTLRIEPRERRNWHNREETEGEMLG